MLACPYKFGDIVIGKKEANAYSLTVEGTKWIVVDIGMGQAEESRRPFEEPMIWVIPARNQGWFLKHIQPILRYHRENKPQFIREYLFEKGICEFFEVLPERFDLAGTAVGFENNEEALPLLKKMEEM